MALPIHPPQRTLLVCVSIEDYAYVLAHVSRYQSTSEVLSVLGVSRTEWAAAHAWPLRMAATTGAKEFSLAQRFTKTFDATFAALPAPEVKAAPASQPASAIAAGVTRAMSDAAAGHGSARDQDDGLGGATLIGATGEGVLTLPFQARAGASPFAQASAPGFRPAAPGSDDLDRTAEVSNPLVRPALPFQRLPVSIDEYALFCAGVAPPEVVDRLADTQLLERVRDVYAQTFANDPAKSAEFTQKFYEARRRAR